MIDPELLGIVEALLMSASAPLSLEKLALLLETHPLKPAEATIKQCLDYLTEVYTTHAFEVKCTASGYRVQTKEAYAPWIALMQAEKPARYSRALLETLAIIAWKQPVTRADIEMMRGVAVSSHIMKTLLEREWIRIAGHRDVPGKPAVYVTTKSFLDYFNLQSLQALPSLPDVQALVEKSLDVPLNES